MSMHTRTHTKSKKYIAFILNYPKNLWRQCLIFKHKATIAAMNMCTNSYTMYKFTYSSEASWTGLDEVFNKEHLCNYCR